MLTLLLALLYPISIQIERKGFWLALAPVALLMIVIDAAANWSELSLLFMEWPQRGEWTFSDRLVRLQDDMGWRGYLARPIVKILNWIAPSGAHIHE